MPTKVSILIFISNPFDYTKYRYMVLFFEFLNRSIYIIYIEGMPGFFVF